MKLALRTVFPTLLCAAPAYAHDSSSWGEQFLVYGLPLLVVIVLWYWVMRRGKLGDLTERSFTHMDRLEEKLDRIIRLLERRED